MGLLRKILLVFFFLASIFARSQTPMAPVTTAASVTNATTTPGGTVVPVTVTGFTDIGNCYLTLQYNRSDYLSYVSAIPNPAFTGMTVTNTQIQGLQWQIVISWSGSNGITLPDLTHLVDLVFTYYKESCLLSWTRGSCSYEKYAGGAFINCIDTPSSKYYITGGVSNRGAPVTILPVVSNATPGSCSLPIKVTNFNKIASISLLLKYDPAVLSYVSYVPNNALGSMGVYNNTNNGQVLIYWYYMSYPTLGVTLPDGSTMLTLNFTYSNTTKGYSALNWVIDKENGINCSYGDTAGSVLIDSPSKNYFINGLIYGSSQYSPQTWLPSIANATAGSISVPVDVSGFTNVNSFTLSFTYKSAVMTYGSFVQNPALTGTMIVTNNTPDTSGNRKLVMTWTGSSPQSLPAGSSLCTLNFTYISGASTLGWVTDASSCRFNDASGNAYYDLPKSNYYSNGMVTAHPAPLTAAWYGTGTIGQSVFIPVNVWHYSNIGSFNLTLFYDPGVLTYQSASLEPPLGGTFTPTNPEPGRLTLAWNGPAATYPDSSDLVNLMFTYHGGNTPLAWYTAGTSCQYAEGAALPALYDIPKANYYVNGNVGPSPVNANFSTNNTTPAVNATVIFSDLTTGSPDTWNWNFSPSTYMYVDSTNSSSKNPHVQFTMPASYTVTLIASRGTSSNVAVKTSYIKIPDIWTGITSSGWSTASNWNTSIIPGNYTDVQIPASAPHWPIVDSLVIGTQCRSITMAGPSSLTVNGNFTISNGSFLTFTGADTLKIGKNWYNTGIFNSGNGTVEFIGSNNGIIEPVMETFYNLIEAKTAGVLNIPWTIIVNGKFILK